MALLELSNHFTWDGRKFRIWRSHCLWGFDYGLYFSLIQNKKTICSTKWFCRSSVVTQWQGTGILLLDWSLNKFKFPWSRGSTALLSSRNALLTFRFHFQRILKLCVFFHCKRIELAPGHNIKDLGIFVDGNVQLDSFPPPNKHERTKQAILGVLECCR